MTKSIIFVAILCGSIFIGCSSSEAKQNFKDLHKIEVGIKIEQVYIIMKNPPLKIENPYYIDTLFVDYYESTVNAGDDFMIIYSKKDSTVVEVFWGD